jgi:hypothetical protein
MPKVLKTFEEARLAPPSPPEVKKSYVVFYLESTSQGTKSGSRIVNGYNNALDYCKELKTGFCGSTLEVRLFELGRETPLDEPMK